MSDVFDKFKKMASEEGYELAHGQEGYGEHFFGLMILVKMSNRKVCDKDSPLIYRAADTIRAGLERVTASLDPEGPAKRERYRLEFANIYKAAGVEAIYMEMLPNGYSSDPSFLNVPWFRVTSKIGHVVIGWRKRVIEINWKDTIMKVWDAEKLFPDENVTRVENTVHAWGSEKASEYIRRLHQV